MAIKRAIAVVAAQRSNRIPAVVVDVLGDRCSVRLSNATGRLMRNLKYSGGTPSALDNVVVVYHGNTPIVETNSPNVENAVANAAITVVNNIVQGGGGDTEIEPPDPGETGRNITTLEDGDGLTSGDNNDYNPTGYDASIDLIMVFGDIDDTSVITGLTGGTNGRVITILNFGEPLVTISKQNAGSAAENRFDFLPSEFVLGYAQSMTFFWNETYETWYPIGLMV